MKQRLKTTSEAIKILSEKKILIHPTDTVYGISAAFDAAPSYKKIFSLKKRSYDKPLGILISEVSQIEMFSDVPLSALSKVLPLIEKGITILLPIKKTLPSHLVSQSDFIGVRIPAHDGIKTIIRNTSPLISTSANLSGLDPISSFTEVEALLESGVYFLEGDIPKSSTPSTILRYECGNYTLIREGNVSNKEVNIYI